MRIDVLTLFPGMFAPVLGESVLGRAMAAGLLEVNCHDIRAFTLDKHRRCDDYPLGGGPGMVMTAQPVLDAARHADGGMARRVFLSPRGRVLTQALAAELSREPRLTLLCGHYEGVDQRAVELGGFEEVSVGDYVLTGGELPAMTLIDCVARQIPGVLGCAQSLEEESHAGGLLEAPQYTRPAEFEGVGAPDVLLGGHHARIAEWRRAQALRLTWERRPELLDARALSYADLRAIRPDVYTLAGKVAVKAVGEGMLTVSVDRARAGFVKLEKDAVYGAFIADMTVAESFRGAGLERLLALKAEEWAVARGCAQIVVRAPKANAAFWLDAGYSLCPAGEREIFAVKGLTTRAGLI